MILQRKKCISWLCAGLCWIRFCFPSAAAQQTPPGSPLNITILEGEGAVNNIRQRTGRDIVIQVVDQNQRPAAGAAVVFTLPSQGASGSFLSGDKTLAVTADEQGKAVARGFRPNNAPGKFEIQVSATAQGQTARAVITEFNMDVRKAAKGGNGKVVAIIAVLGAAAAGGAAVGLRGSKSSSPTTVSPPTVALVPISITPGAGSVGPPSQ